MNNESESQTNSNLQQALGLFYKYMNELNNNNNFIDINSQKENINKAYKYLDRFKTINQTLHSFKVIDDNRFNSNNNLYQTLKNNLDNLASSINNGSNSTNFSDVNMPSMGGKKRKSKKRKTKKSKRRRRRKSRRIR
jgi:hypothetical protein